MCLWLNLENNFKVTPIGVGNMDSFIFFTLVWGADAENNERKLHKWNEVKLSFLSRYMYFLSLYGINPLTPNDPYSGRTAPLTFKVAFYIFIQQI